MSDNLSKYVDGWFGTEREITVRPNPSFPFSNQPIPDKYSRTYNRMFQIVPANYSPKIINRTAYTNLLTYSQDLTNAAWTKGSSAAALSALTAPDGTVTLDSLLELAASAEHNVTQAATVTAAPTMMGAFGKSGLGRSFIRLAFTDSAAAVFYAYFNVAAGSIGALSAGVTAAIFPLANGDYWCTAKFTPAAGAGTFKTSLSADGVNANLSYAGDAAKGAYVWGCQVGALPTLGASGPASCGPYVATTTASRSVLAPDVDSKDPMAYMVGEGDPVLHTSDSGTVARQFERIPKQQIMPSSISISKPALSGTFPQVYGGFRVFQPDTTLLKYDIYSTVPVTGDSGPVTAGYPTGGTYTISFGGSTTGNLNYNDSAGTVQTALNALTSVSNRGGVTVSGTYNSVGGFVITFNDYASATANTAGLTPSGTGISYYVTPTNGGYTQSFLAQAALGGIADAGAVLTSSLTYDAGSGESTCTTQTGNMIQCLAYRTNGSANGGTFTLTYFGQTTAPLAYNANIETTEAAINAACSTLMALGAITVSKIYYYYHGGYGINVTVLVNPEITGGTWTFTIFGQTTGNLNWNDSLATISAAINGLSEVIERGGCVLYGTGFFAGQISFTFQFANLFASVSSGSLTPSPSTVSVSITDGVIGKAQKIVFSAITSSRSLYAVAHGITVGSTLYIKTDATYTLFPGTFSVPDSNTIIIAVTPGSIPATATAITEVGKGGKIGYAPGAASVRCLNTTEFYLPGVTPGVFTAADIPIPQNQSESGNLLPAIFAGAGTINYAVGQLTQYAGPILSIITTTVQAADL